jgi:hypothetical protein
MNNSRLGCLTPSGLIAAGLTIVIIVVITLLQGGVVFTPGALNAVTGNPLGGYASHAEFSGQCRLCHAPFWDASGMAARCEACHTEIPVQLADPATLHGALVQRNPSLACRDCHPEHRGATAALTDFHGSGFPHEVLGYSLAGHAHTSGGLPFICADCHSTDVTSFDPALCQTCHTQIDPAFTTTHILSFGTNCLVCHDGIDTYGSDFDHNRFLFKLTGKHVGTPCSSCHLNARTVPDMQSAPTDCNSCHAKDDIHQGSLGADCAACHTPDDWIPANFDHNLAAFKLEGKHADVLCESCHIDKLFKNTPTDCNSCHSGDDAHQGNLGINCENCHTPAGWTPATFDHNLAAFKLEGQHANVACDSCHQDKLYKNTPTDCYSCHAADDAHQGRFGTGCGTCHSPAGWIPATFDHNLAAFKLNGKHANVACESCHINGVFQGTPTDCYSCHAGNDEHQGRFGTGCGTCHTTSGWSPATFDHNLAAFKLTGMHTTVACGSCHANGFQGTPTSCFACHSGDDNHQGRFGTNCGSCHSTSGWTPASFDHNISGFPLTGAHAGLACTRCHTGGIFTTLPTACSACHSEPAFHAGLFGGMGCDQCHNTSSWTPASFNLSHPSGCDGPCINHRNASCRDCHTSNLNSATCTKCHDSNNPGD